MLAELEWGKMWLLCLGSASGGSEKLDIDIFPGHIGVKGLVAPLARQKIKLLPLRRSYELHVSYISLSPSLIPSSPFHQPHSFFLLSSSPPYAEFTEIFTVLMTNSVHIQSLTVPFTSLRPPHLECPIYSKHSQNLSLPQSSPSLLALPIKHT